MSRKLITKGEALAMLAAQLAAIDGALTVAREEIKSELPAASDLVDRKVDEAHDLVAQLHREAAERILQHPPATPE